MVRCASRFATVFVVFAVLAPLPATAADFPPITAEEKALTEVPGHPQASAVYLFKRGELQMVGTVGTQESTVQRVEARIKILTEEGKEEFGELSIVHNRWLRLRNFRGRTVLPGGEVIPLPEAAVFTRQSSRSQRLYTTAAAFPALEVGAIIDYSYEIYYDTLLLVTPWQFQERVPVLASEIRFKVPKFVQARAWQRNPMKVEIHNETKRSAVGYEVRAWAEDLPPVPDEPYGFPEADLASQFMVVPVETVGANGGQIYDTWASTCDLLDPLYHDARRDSGSVRSRGRKVAAAVDRSSPRKVAEALYKLVRDKVETVEWPAVFPRHKVTLSEVLKKKQGSYAEKGLLLQTLLEAAKIEADIVWASDRDNGMVDSQLPIYTWFDRVLVRAQVEGETVFLDPSDPGLAFGRLDEDYEGTTAVIFDTRKPELVVLPTSTCEDNVRRARMQLTVGEEGRVSGSGSLEMTGHSASRRFQSSDVEEWWQEWLEERFEGYEIDGVEVEQRPDEGRVHVAWTLEQAAAEVLGDEVSLSLTRPLGPEVQRFTLPAYQRRTPVRLAFPNRAEVEVSVSWPEGWAVDLAPEATEHDNGAGLLATRVEVEAEARTLRFHRRLDVTSAQFMGPHEYSDVRLLFAMVEKSDAQALVLVQQ